MTNNLQQNNDAILNTKSNERDLKGLKKLMEKRQQQRSLAFYFLINQKKQTALIWGRKLLFTSQKIWKEFNDDLREMFEEMFFFRTRKAKEQTQYLMDAALLCKIFSLNKKKEDIVEVIDKLEFPETEVPDKKKLKIKEDIIKFNQLKEIHSKSCALYLTFIEITKNEKIYDQTRKFFENYCQHVRKYFSDFQYATAKFKHANFFFQINDYGSALKQYEKCLQLRNRNTLNEGFVDTLINTSICLRQLGKLGEACEKASYALQVYRDSALKNEKTENEYILLLAKLQLENGEFEESYENYFKCYDERISLEKQDPRRVQIELNIIFFYESLKKIEEKPLKMLNLKDRKEIQQKREKAGEVANKLKETILKRDQFSKYKYVQSSKSAHLNLVVTDNFFELLNSEQVEELNNLMRKISKFPFSKGKNELMKTSFWEEKKCRDILIQTNQQLRM